MSSISKFVFMLLQEKLIDKFDISDINFFNKKKQDIKNCDKKIEDKVTDDKIIKKDTTKNEKS
jgi:hypothetical protein